MFGTDNDFAGIAAIAPFLRLTPCPSRKSYPQVAMMPSGQDLCGGDGPKSFEKLGAWDGVKNKITQAESVRAALLLVAGGEAPLGTVYQTDATFDPTATSDPTVKIVGTSPENTHPPIICPIALTKESSNPDAMAFSNFIRSPAARPAFERQGFTVLAAGGRRP